MAFLVQQVDLTVLVRDDQPLGTFVIRDMCHRTAVQACRFAPIAQLIIRLVHTEQRTVSRCKNSIRRCCYLFRVGVGQMQPPTKHASFIKRSVIIHQFIIFHPFISPLRIVFHQSLRRAEPDMSVFSCCQCHDRVIRHRRVIRREVRQDLRHLLIHLVHT